MISELSRYTSRLGLWVASIAASAVLLAVFMFLHRQDSTVLGLDTKWLVVASIPLIVALLKSNIIQRFQGFGFELETRLGTPIGRISVEAIDALDSVPGDEKATVNALNSLDDAVREERRRLTFIQGQGTHYEVQAMTTYLKKLPNLEFLEVRERRGRFVALLPINVFQDQEGGVDDDQVSKLRKALESHSVGDEFGTDGITESVRDEGSLLTVLPKLRDSQFGVLPVVSGNRRLRGVVTTPFVEKRIASAVLDAQELSA